MRSPSNLHVVPQSFGPSAGRGSAVNALVVAVAEPAGAVLTGDLADLRALAAHADDVIVLRS